MSKEPNDLNVENEIAAEGWKEFCGKLHTTVYPSLSEEEFTSTHGEALNAYLEEWNANIINESVFLSSLGKIMSGYIKRLDPEQMQGLNSLGARQVIGQAVAWNQSLHELPEEIRVIDSDRENRVKIARVAGLALVALGAVAYFASRTGETPTAVQAYAQATKQPESTLVVQAPTATIETITKTDNILNLNVVQEVTPTVESPVVSQVETKTEVVKDFKVAGIDLSKPLKLIEQNGSGSVDIAKYPHQVVIADSAETWKAALEVYSDPPKIPGAQIVIATNTSGYVVSLHSGVCPEGECPAETVKKAKVGSIWKDGNVSFKLTAMIVVSREVFAQSQRVYANGSDDGSIKPGQTFIDARFLADQVGVQLPVGEWLGIEACTGEWDGADYIKRFVAVLEPFDLKQLQSKLKAW